MFSIKGSYKELGLYLHGDVSAELFTEQSVHCSSRIISFSCHLQCGGRHGTFVADRNVCTVWRTWSCNMWSQVNSPLVYYFLAIRGKMIHVFTFLINKSMKITQLDLELEDHRVFDTTLMLIFKLKLCRGVPFFQKTAL